MNRFRTYQAVSLEVMENSNINIEEFVKSKIAREMANFLLDAFKIEAVGGFPYGSKDYLIDLFVGEYSDIEKVNTLLNKILGYAEISTDATGNIIAHHVYAIKTILFNNLKQKSK